MTFTIVILRAKPEGSLPGFPEMVLVKAELGGTRVGGRNSDDAIVRNAVLARRSFAALRMTGGALGMIGGVPG